MAKALELAIAKATKLSEAAQEEIGREWLERLDALAALRAELEIGVRELDEGKGKELDIKEVIARAREEHASR